MTRTFSLLVLSVATISLIIGGVGILGVMLLSIRERVSEIGIRRAVGARRKDILVQFLVESSFLGVVGGIAGLVLGVGGSSGSEAFLRNASGFGSQLRHSVAYLLHCHRPHFRHLPVVEGCSP